MPGFQCPDLSIPMQVLNVPQPKKEKTGLELKSEERGKREAEERERKETMRQERGMTLDTSGMDEAAAEKARRKHFEESADLDNAIDAFGRAGKKPYTN